MSDDFAEKLRTLNIGARNTEPRVRRDDHGTHTVEVVEHPDGRQDVTVSMREPVRSQPTINET